MQFSSEKEPAKIPWGRAGVDVVIESSGALRGRKDAAGHLQGGARTVLISAPFGRCGRDDCAGGE